MHIRMCAVLVILVACCLCLSKAHALYPYGPLHVVPLPISPHSMLRNDPSGAVSPYYNFAPITQNIYMGHPTGSYSPWDPRTSSVLPGQMNPAHIIGSQFFQQAGSFGGPLPIMHQLLLQASAQAEQVFHLQTIPQPVSSHVVMSSPMQTHTIQSVPQAVAHPMSMGHQMTVPEMPGGLVSLTVPEKSIPLYGTVKHVQFVQQPSPLQTSMLSMPPQEVIHVTSVDQWSDPGIDAPNVLVQALSEAGKILVQARNLLLRLGDAMSEITGKTDFFLCPLLLNQSATTLMIPPSRSDVLECLSPSTCGMLTEHGPKLCRYAPGNCSLVVTVTRLCPLLHGTSTRSSWWVPMKRK